ncbi:MAG: type IA DNA topoisomerase [Cellulosilyticum sp.]|nr:type IA DNA topoisomerase [Cellulosilyticum sp.]
MSRSVIICEKPSVAEEFAKALKVPFSAADKKRGYFLSDSWAITWSYGHLITMSYPESYDEALKKWDIATLPFIPKSYKYEVINSGNTKHQFSVVKKLYNSKEFPIDKIYLAGDSGREGLYIQCLILQEAGHTANVPVKVVWIDSQTEAEILRGIKDAKDLKDYTPYINAGYMRAIEDYLIGINYSRILSLKYGNLAKNAASLSKNIPLQIGRVMTCVLGMVVDRERAISGFKPTTFYRVIAKVNDNEFEWKATPNTSIFTSPSLYQDIGFLNESDAKNFLAERAKYPNLECTEKSVEKERKYAPLLYSLAELQGDCTKKLSRKLSPSETLDIAQSLYEKKLTTYPRTDARVLTTAIEAVIYNNIKGLAKGEFKAIAEDILNNNRKIGKSGKKYVDDSKVTDHYAIIPTGVTPHGLTDIEKEVYDLICKRFLSIFYPPAVFEKTTIKLMSGDETFFGTSKVLVDKGFLEVTGDIPANSKDLSTLAKGGSYPGTYEIKEGKTSAPTRYDTGSIILAMENAGKLIEDEALREQIKESGIGTSATRGDIIDKLLSIGYISSNKKTQAVYSTVLGEIIYEIVYATIPNLLKPNMTASWEKGLSQVEEKKIRKADYEAKLNADVAGNVNRLKTSDEMQQISDAIKAFATGEITNEKRNIQDQYKDKYTCPNCGSEIVGDNFKYECSCGLSIPKYLCKGWVPGSELDKLVEKGETEYLSGFVNKEGKSFSAKLVLEGTTVKFVSKPKKGKLAKGSYPDTIECPNCKSTMTGTDFDYACNCGLKIQKYAFKQWIPFGEIENLLSKGSTDYISGLKKKDGKSMTAKFVLDGANIKLEFKPKSRKGGKGRR